VEGKDIKPDRFLQPPRLPEVAWQKCTPPRAIKLWEHEKQNGNVRISELGILATMAANCEDHTNLTYWSKG
jgi:hypothetical protein